MRIVDRYIFREWLTSFGLSLGAILGILLLVDTYNSLHDLITLKASAGQILYYYAVVIPSFLPLVIPIALLISILFSLGNLHRTNEITALRAGGMSVFQITRSLWVSGAVLAFLLLALNAYLVPWSVEKSRELEGQLHSILPNGQKTFERATSIGSLTFNNAKDHNRWFMNIFSDYHLRGFGVMFSQLDASDDFELERVLSREAYYDENTKEWVFLKGRIITYEPSTGEPIFSLPFEEKRIGELTETPRLMIAMSKDPKDLSLFELRSIINTYPLASNPAVRPYAVRYHMVLSAPFACLVVVGIAVPFAVAGVRRNPMIGVSKSAFLFFAYYIIANTCRILGSQDVINLFVAAWFPNVFMLGVAVHFYRKLF